MLSFLFKALEGPARIARGNAPGPSAKTYRSPERAPRRSSSFAQDAEKLAAAALSLILFGVIAFDARWGIPSRAPLPADAHAALLLLAFLVYLPLAWIIVRRTLGIPMARWLMVVAVAMRIVVLAGPHRANSDIWRYVWDGHVLANGFNPFAHAPDDPALDAVRDPAIYGAMNPDYNGIRTVYGPAAAACFAPVARFAADPARAMRLVMTLGDVLAIVLLAALLRRVGLPESWALLYALHPLPLDAFAERGQMEGILLPLLILAALFAVQRRPGMAGAVLAVAALVKAPALLAFPLFVVALGRGDRRSGMRFAGAFAVAGVLIAVPFAGAGPEALSGLVRYGVEWRTNGALFPVFEGMFGRTTGIAISINLLIAVYWTLCARLRGPHGIPAALALAFGAVLLLAPAVFPWYLAWALPFAPFLLPRAPTRAFGWAVLAWAGLACLWYLRFVVYPPLDAPAWPDAARALHTAAAWFPEPWRLVEYGALAILAIPVARPRTRAPAA